MKTLSLNTKIIALIAIFFTGTVIVATIGFVRINHISETMDYMIDFTVKRLNMSNRMESLSHQIRNREKVYILEDSTAGMDLEGKKLDELEAKMNKEFDDYYAIATEVGKRDIEKLREIMGRWKPVSIEMRKFSYEGKNDEAEKLARGKSREILEEFAKIVEGLITRNIKFLEDANLKADAAVSSAKMMMTVSTLLSLILGSILAGLILKSISKAIDQVITNLNDSSGQVASASSTIASSSEELSQATTEQAASLEQTAASVEEMSKMVNRNAENARAASENSQFSQQSALKGKETVNEMIRSIDEINNSNNKIMEQINYSNEQMADIVKVINEIGNKTKVINDIVFQTKLLSFNASVEAARAGEHGKGFAVVAEEVGNLASMSGNAAKEITTMLDESIRKVEMTVQETKTSVDRLISDGKVKINNGIKVANDCGNVLEEIVVSIAKVNAMAEEISTASVEQSQGISEITKAMHQLDQVTQQNAAASEEAASSAEELSAQAEVLKATVGVLVTTIKGGEQTYQQASAPAMSMSSTPTYSTTKSNVIQMTKPAAKKTVAHMPVKKAVGAMNESSSNEKAPAYDDARFKDV